MRFSDVIDLWPSARVLAEDIGEKTASVHKWRQRNSIPGEKWLAVVSAAEQRGFELNLARLAAIAAAEAPVG